MGKRTFQRSRCVGGDKNRDVGVVWVAAALCRQVAWEVEVAAAPPLPWARGRCRRRTLVRGGKGIFDFFLLVIMAAGLAGPILYRRISVV
jgi:hypothetical protein